MGHGTPTKTQLVKMSPMNADFVGTTFRLVQCVGWCPKGFNTDRFWIDQSKKKKTMQFWSLLEALLNLIINKGLLGGGNSNIYYVHPDAWGDDPIWWAYFSDGLKPTNQIVFFPEKGDRICLIGSKDPFLAAWIIRPKRFVTSMFVKNFGGRGWKTPCKYFPYNPCMVYLPTFSWFLWW